MPRPRRRENENANSWAISDDERDARSVRTTNVSARSSPQPEQPLRDQRTVRAFHAHQVDARRSHRARLAAAVPHHGGSAGRVDPRRNARPRLYRIQQNHGVRMENSIDFETIVIAVCVAAYAAIMLAYVAHDDLGFSSAQIRHAAMVAAALLALPVVMDFWRGRISLRDRSRIAVGAGGRPWRRGPLARN